MQRNPSRLSARGPVDPRHGFPRWYKDAAGVRLELAFDPADPRTPAIGDLPDPAAPVSFPRNFPDEAFYFLAEAELPVGGGPRPGRARMDEPPTPIWHTGAGRRLWLRLVGATDEPRNHTFARTLEIRARGAGTTSTGRGRSAGRWRVASGRSSGPGSGGTGTGERHPWRGPARYRRISRCRPAPAGSGRRVTHGVACRRPARLTAR